MWRDSFICVTWLTHLRDMTHPYVCHDTLIRVTWHAHNMYDMTQSSQGRARSQPVSWPMRCDIHSMWQLSFTCLTRPIHMRAVTYSYVWRDSWVHVTWLMHVCDMTDITQSYVWHFSFVSWLVHECDMTHPYLWYDSFMYVTRRMFMLIFSYESRLICIREIADSCTWHDSPIYVTWLVYKRDMTHLHTCHETHVHIRHDSFVYLGAYFVWLATRLWHSPPFSQLIARSHMWNNSLMNMTHSYI